MLFLLYTTKITSIRSMLHYHMASLWCISIQWMAYSYDLYVLAVWLRNRCEIMTSGSSVTLELEGQVECIALRDKLIQCALLHSAHLKKDIGHLHISCIKKMSSSLCSISYFIIKWTLKLPWLFLLYLSVGCQQSGPDAPVPVGGASERGGSPVSRWRPRAAWGFCPAQRVKDLIGLKTGKSAARMRVWSGSPAPGARYVYCHINIHFNLFNVGQW